VGGTTGREGCGQALAREHDQPRPNDRPFFLRSKPRSQIGRHNRARRAWRGQSPCRTRAMNRYTISRIPGGTMHQRLPSLASRRRDDPGCVVLPKTAPKSAQIRVRISPLAHAGQIVISLHDASRMLAMDTERPRSGSSYSSAARCRLTSDATERVSWPLGYRQSMRC